MNRDDVCDVCTMLEQVEAAILGGDYYAGNMIFIAALHHITRGMRRMDRRTFHEWMIVEIAEPVLLDTEAGMVGYYDLLHISACGWQACLPMPMLRAEITRPAYRWCELVPRGLHARVTDVTLPPIWRESAYGYIRAGEEVARMYLSDGGLAEVADLKGRRIGRGGVMV